MTAALVIFHANCPDGFTAAWVARSVLSEEPDGVEFHDGVYGQDPPDCTGRDVYLLDFTYGPDQMVAISERAHSLNVLDHHQTAIANCDPIDRGLNVSIELDMDRSGARLAWDYFCTGQDVPDIVKFVEDRDLWRFTYPETKDYYAALTARPYTFDAWDEISTMDLWRVVAEGQAINRYRDQLIAQAVALAAYVDVPGLGFLPAANCPYAYASDVAGIIAATATIENLDVPGGRPIPLKIGVYYFDDHAHGVRQWGLRSTDDGPDVAAMAEKMGGGGHKHAAGFKTPIPC